MSKKASYKISVKLREKTLNSGNKSLYLDIYQGKGRRSYEFLGINYNPKDKVEKREKKAIADKIRSKKEYELINLGYGIISPFKAKSNFIDYFEKLADEKADAEKAWWNTLKHLKDYTGGNIQFNAIDENWLEDLKKYLMTKVSTNTAHTYFSKIKASLTRAVKDKILIINPAQSVKQIPKKDVQRSYLTIEEIEKLSQTRCRNDQVKLAFLFACNTGLRLGDIKRLSYNDILLPEKKLILKQMKTGEVIYQPLNETAIKIISNLKNNSIQDLNNNIFDLPSETVIRKVIINWLKEADIKKHITFHSSRHTFATIALYLGTDLFTVSKLLGHKSIKNTQIYAKIMDETMKDAMSKFDNIKINI